jgi:hypothetical protein
MTDVPSRYDTHVSCMIGDQFYRPLGLIAAMLFDPKPTLSCRSSAEQMMAKAKQILSIPDSSILMARHRLTLDQPHLDALSAMGKLAAHALFQVKAHQLPDNFWMLHLDETV